MRYMQVQLDNIKALSYFKKEEDEAGKLVYDEDRRAMIMWTYQRSPPAAPPSAVRFRINEKG